MNYFWQQLFDPDESESLGQRLQFLAFEVVVLVRANLELWRWAEIIPNQPGVPKPSGIANYIDVSFLMQGAAAQINAALCGLLLLLGLSGRVRGAYAGAFAAFALQYAARFGLGKVQHGTNMLGMALLALAIAELAYRDVRVRRKATLGLVVLMFSIGYSLAAFAKYAATGLRWVRGQNLWLWIEQKRIDTLSAGGHGELNALQALVMRSKPLATFFLCLGLASETAAVVMWWRPARRWVMLALAGMHMGISAVMNIHFTASVLILLAFGLPIAEIVDALHARLPLGRAPLRPTGQPEQSGGE